MIGLRTGHLFYIYLLGTFIFICWTNKYKGIIVHRKKKRGTERERDTESTHSISCFPFWKQDPSSSLIFHRQDWDGWGFLMAVRGLETHISTHRHTYMPVLTSTCSRTLNMLKHTKEREGGSL